MAVIVALGLLRTHTARTLIARWGWCESGWRAFFPRVLATALMRSPRWSALGYGYNYEILRPPWDSKYSPFRVFSISWRNDALLLGHGYFFYFIYHLFDRFNRSEIERLRLMTAGKDSELRALKSSVTPHLSLNASNSLPALIGEDSARAQLVVTQCANFLRYSR